MSSVFYPLPRVLPAISRNPLFIQLGNTGFRNCERLHQFLPLLTSIHGPLITVQKKRISWDCMKIVNALCDLRTKKSDDSQALDLLPTLNSNAEDLNYSGIQKGIYSATEMGFIYPAADIHIRQLSEERLLTDRGHHYIKASTWRAQSYLIAQSIACLPYQMESSSDFILFRLATIFKALKELQQEVKLTPDELTCFVFSKSWRYSGKTIAQKIADQREGQTSETRYAQVYSTLVKELGIKQETLKTYTHANLMALKSTGLFQARQASLRPESHLSVFWDAFAQRKNPFGNPETIAQQRQALEMALSKKSRAKFDDIALIELLSELDGRKAFDFSNPEENVKNALLILENRYKSLTFNGKKYEKQDINGPAALEWALPIAIASCLSIALQNSAWGGTYDANGCPFQHTPSGRSDAIIETDGLCLGLEATLTQGLQQNQAEHISVSRHAALLPESTTATHCFTLFVAPNIDINLYSSFGHNPWFYEKEKGRKYVPVIPLTCQQFSRITQHRCSEQRLVALLNSIDTARPFHSGLGLEAWIAQIENACACFETACKN